MTYTKHIIIDEIDGELAVQILKPGYNIIEHTLYKPELAKIIFDAIEEASEL